MPRYTPENWTGRASSAIAVVILVAVGARLAYWLLAPVLPALIVGLGVLGIFMFIVGRR